MGFKLNIKETSTHIVFIKVDAYLGHTKELVGEGLVGTNRWWSCRNNERLSLILLCYNILSGGIQNRRRNVLFNWFDVVQID